MKVTPIKTSPVTDLGDINSFLDNFLPPLKENTVVTVTSKIVAIFEGRTIKNPEAKTKNELVEKEAEQFIDPKYNQYGFHITIKENILIASAGIDESNGNGSLVLWPKNPYESAKNIWNHIRSVHNIKNVGVILTDSKVTPLRWGVTGIGIAYCGFSPLNDFRNKPDIFGRPLHVTQVNVLDALSASAVLTMGESNEQTPLAIIQDVPFVTFQDHSPTNEERNRLHISLEEDIFSPLLVSDKWQKGKP